MKKLALAFLLITFCHSLMAQDDADTTYWTKGGVLGINFSNVGLTNWAAGGVNSLSGVGLISLSANYKRDKATWDNTLDLGYGLLKQADSDVFKSDDKIELNSKYGRPFNDNWYYSALLQFKTQFAPGFANPGDTVNISDFLAPGYMVLAVGADYKPNDKLTVLIAPATLKLTFVQDQDLADAGAFGVEAATFDDQGTLITPGENLRQEFGGFLKIAYKTDLMENVKLESKADFFSNYLVDPDHIDVNWENLISMQVNKYISASLTTHLIYDHDIDIGIDTNNDGAVDLSGPRTQFKYVFGLGFTYKW